MKTQILQHRFVEFIPEEVEEGVLYISIDYRTAIHKCACGCGNEVTTPFSVTDWRLIFNGEAITLRPSIGNWRFPCQSHYWITNGRIEPAARWESEKTITSEPKKKRKKKFFWLWK